MRLNRKRIVAGALKLVNEHGLEQLTTRRLGQALHVEGPALYRHFASKNELIDHMAAEILLPKMSPPEPGEDWDEWLISLGHRTYKAVKSYRDGAKIVAASLPIEPLDLISRPLREAGFPEKEAAYGSMLFSRFMAGWQLREDSELNRKDRKEPEYVHLEAFDFALSCLVDGLRLRLNESKRRARTTTQSTAGKQAAAAKK